MSLIENKENQVATSSSELKKNQGVAPLSRTRVGLGVRELSNKVSTIQCSFVEKHEKIESLFLMTGIGAPFVGERIELIEALNQDCSSALAWLNMINHVKKHNSKASEASRRVRLFKRAQSLILETGTDAETLEVWLSYVYELHDLKDESRARSTYEYMRNKGIGESSPKFYAQWSAFESSKNNTVAVAEIIELGHSKAPNKGAPCATTSPPCLPKPPTALEAATTGRTASESPPLGAHPKAVDIVGSDDVTVETLPTMAPQIEATAAVASGVRTRELPDYIKNFDFKKQLEEKRKQDSVSLKSSSAAPKHSSFTSPPAAASAKTSPVLPMASSSTLPSSAGSAAAPAAPAPPAAGASAPLRGSRLVRTGLGSSALRRTGLGGGGGSSGAGPPLRVAPVTPQDHRPEGGGGGGGATEEEEDPAETKAHQGDDNDEDEENGEEEPLEHFVPLRTMRPSLLLAGDLTMGGLDTVAEGSFSDASMSSSSSRRDSASSCVSSGAARSSLGSVRSARVSTSPSELANVSLDATVALDEMDSAAAAGQRRPQRAHGDSGGSDNDDEDETAVVFKNPLSVPLKPPSARSGGSPGGGDGDDNTYVIFKQPSSKAAPAFAAPAGGGLDHSSGVESANSSSITFEAGRLANGGAPPRQDGASHRHQAAGYDSSADEDETEDDEEREGEASRGMPCRRGGGPARGQRRSGSGGGPGGSAADAAVEGHFAELFCRDNVVVVAGKAYFKIGVLGKGGSSKVFRVLSAEGGGGGGGGGAICALKRVRVASEDPKCLASFRNEIRLMESLRGNPCIVQLLASEVAGRTIHMVMEAGETDLNGLLQRHQRQGSLSANFVRLAWQQMLTAVEVIHTHRIVHGDLKPANFLFVQGHLKLIDFGIAKQINNDTTNIYRESQVGTLNYMSPEAIQDGGGGGAGAPHNNGRPCMKLGRASDIWSLGCILYQMVYGHTPFSHITSLMAKLMAIIDVNHAISFPQLQDRSVADAIRSCLQRDPAQRPPIAGPGGLLKQPFLEPKAHGAEPAQAPALNLSAVRQVVRATVEECRRAGDDPASSLSTETVEATVVGKLRQSGAMVPGAGPTPSPAAAALPFSSSSRAQRRTLAAGAAATPTVASAPRDHTPRSGLKGELVEQLGKLRTASASVASKYQKPSGEGGGGTLYSSMQESNLISMQREILDKRRKDLMPEDTVNNTGNWAVDATESWQS